MLDLKHIEIAERIPIEFLSVVRSAGHVLKQAILSLIKRDRPTIINYQLTNHEMDINAQ